MRIIRTTAAPIAYPLELANMHARLDHEDLTAELRQHVMAAFSEAELSGGLALIMQPVRVELDEWPGGMSLALPVGPVQVDAGCTVTAGGEAFTGFRLAHGSRPALVLSASMPPGEVVITYTAGFGAGTDSVPPDVLMAVLDQALVRFDVRGNDGLDSRRRTRSPMFDRVLARYRRVAI